MLWYDMIWQTLHVIAYLSATLGQYAQAEQFYKKSIRMLENVYGTEKHPEVAFAKVPKGPLHTLDKIR